MSLFKAFNARILAAINKRSGTAQLASVSFLNRQLILTHTDGSLRKISWTDLKRIIALRRDLYAGVEVSLFFEISDSQGVEIPESCRGWSELCAAIEAVDDVLPFREWYAQVLLAPMGEAIEVWSRNG